MNTLKRLTEILIFCLVIASINAAAQTSAFTYQGKLTDMSAAANGNYDFTFRLFDAASEGTQISTENVRDDVSVSGGIFTVKLDFGANAFSNGTARFLEISVRAGASTGAYTLLTPRQEITSAPFSLKSLNAASADSLACSLCVTDGQIQSIDGSKVTGTVANATNATNAATAVTAGNVTGIVQITNGGTGSSTKNFVDLSTNQINIGGDKTFTGTVNVNGANGVFSGNGSGLTNVTAQTTVNLSLLGSLRWDLLNPTNIAVGTNPGGIAFDGANIWVANFGSGNVTKLRASDGGNLGTFPVGTNLQSVAFDGANIWVTSSNSNTITKLRTSDGSNLGTFPVGSFPSGIAFDGANIWVANFGSNNVTEIRASDGANLGTFPAGNGPRRVAFDGANIWVVNNGSSSVTKLRASDGSNLGTFAVSSFPIDLAFDGVNIWVTSRGGNNVTKLRASDGNNLGAFPVGTNPQSVAFDGANIWVANGSSNTITKLRASDGSDLGTFPVGNFPGGVVFDGANIWIANFNSNSVTKLPTFR